jgi:hypothetical protein
MRVRSQEDTSLPTSSDLIQENTDALRFYIENDPRLLKKIDKIVQDAMKTNSLEIADDRINALIFETFADQATKLAYPYNVLVLTSLNDINWGELANTFLAPYRPADTGIADAEEEWEKFLREVDEDPEYADLVSELPDDALEYLDNALNLINEPDPSTLPRNRRTVTNPNYDYTYAAKRK